MLLWQSPIPVGTPDVGSAKKSKKGDAGEEDVDILDDMPPTHYPSVEIEKEVASSSSSSSDSDSSSSSGIDCWHWCFFFFFNFY